MDRDRDAVVGSGVVPDAGLNALAGALAEEEALFTLLGRALYGMPDRELFSAMAEEGFFDEIPFMDAMGAALVADARADLQVWSRGCAAPLSDDDFEAVRVVYARLFVGAQRVAAPVWESVYFNRDRMVFQQQTMDVRAAYRAYGLEVERYGHEPDDHLASELLFVAHLASLARTALDDGDLARAAAVLRDQRSFVADHPLTWVDAWRDLVIERTVGDSDETGESRGGANRLYAGCARLVVAACQQAWEFADRALEELALRQ